MGKTKTDTNAATTTETEKPKRVLTEAQRLAFLKGREKRMANIEKKRQEQLEQTQTPVTTNESDHHSDTEESSSGESTAKEDIEQIPIPKLKRQTNKMEETTPEPTPAIKDVQEKPNLVTDYDIIARKCADYLFDRMSLEIPDDSIPSIEQPPQKSKPKPKQKRSVDDNDRPQRKTRQESAPVVESIPQRVFSWG